MVAQIRMVALLGLALAGVSSVTAQSPTAAPKRDLGVAYYHAALGHLYSELASQYGGRGEYVTKAIENFKLAMRADPDSAYLSEELADLYLASGQLRSAINEFEDLVKRNPDDLNARRILGRFYTARLREGNQSRANQEMLDKALEQYQKVAERSPRDVANWVMLGRLNKLANKSKDAEAAYKKALELDGENEDAMTGLAIVYSDLGDTAQATAMLKRVAEKNPSLRTLTALAATYEQMKEFKLAASAYKQALDLNPTNTDLKRAYAQALFRAEDNDGAAKVFDEILTEDPNDLAANLLQSKIAVARKDFAKAKTYARKARELDPNNLEIRFNEVEILTAENKLPEAIAMLKEMLDTIAKPASTQSEKSNRVILLERLGNLYRQSEQVEPAVAAFAEIARLDPEVATRASAQVVETYRGARRYKDAEKEALATLAKHPDDRLSKLMLVNVQSDLGEYEKAASALKALMDGKNDKETYLSLAQVYEKAKNYPEMAKSIDAAEKLASSDDERETVWFMRGAMLEKQKKFEAAEAEFRKVLKQNPNSASALNYLGYMLADRNVRLTEALEMILKAVEQEPGNGAFLDSLGWAYFRVGKLEEAEENLRKALLKTPRDPAIHDHMADLQAARGNLKDAVAHWEQSLKEYRDSPPGDNDPAEVAKVQKKLEGGKMRLAKEGTAKK
jgi:tetratricopeptide (TPR) repeat protein